MNIEKQHIYLFFCVFFLFCFSVFSGLRENSIDYSEYIIMIRNTLSGDTLFEKMTLAKDPLFGLIVHFVNPEKEIDYKYVFLWIAILGFISKSLVLPELKGHLFLFIVLYVLLLSPGLDFSAIRAMLALSFFAAAIGFKSSNKNVLYVIFSILSVLSHISLIAAVLISSNWVLRMLRKYTWQAVLFGVILISQSKEVLGGFANTSTYINNSGTIFAFFSPLFFLASIIFYRYFIKGDDEAEERVFGRITFDISFVLSIVALTLTPIVVVASFRIMEIGQFVFLLTICSTPLKSHLNTLSKYICFVFVLLLYSTPLIFRNLQLDLWLNIYNNI